MQGDISGEVLLILRRITRALDLNSKTLVRVYGLTGPQLVILNELQKYHEISVGDLARFVNLSHATVTDILDRLEKRTLILRTRSQEDRRKVLVQITEEGITLVKGVPFVLKERFRQEFQKLKDWEQTLILSSLQRIAEMMEMEDSDDQSLWFPAIPSSLTDSSSGIDSKSTNSSN